MLEKNLPNTSAFSILELTVTELPEISTLFKSPMPVLVLRLLLINFQKAFGFCLQC